jgi:isocitrate dehydrogenase
VAAEYPDIASDTWIVDIGAARLADTPEMFDVVVMPNLYGDILSDVAAQIAGSIGLAPSVNIGEYVAMFEAIHGSAPDIAGKDIANPTGLLLAGVQMLVHLGQGAAAERVHNAWLKTVEEGLHTADIYREGTSREKVGTRAFADAVIARLGETPSTLPAVSYAEAAKPISVPTPQRAAPAKKVLEGVDVFVHADIDADSLAAKLKSAEGEGLRLALITNRGVKVWPDGLPETFCTDHWRCRFMLEDGAAAETSRVVDLLGRLSAAGVDFVKTEHLYAFDGTRGYSLGQGQ